MNKDSLDATSEQNNLNLAESPEIKPEQPFTPVVDTEMAEEYGFSPQQAEEMSLYL